MGCAGRECVGGRLSRRGCVSEIGRIQAGRQVVEALGWMARYACVLEVQQCAEVGSVV